MEILFKDENYIYYIKDTHLTRNSIKVSNLDLDNIPHLNNTKVLYHYSDENSRTVNSIYPVYYEHNGRIITEIANHLYYVVNIDENYIKDYTLVNLKHI